MSELKTIEDIQKEFKFEWLAKTSDDDKFMHKVYLKLKLKGGKLFATAYTYSMKRLVGKFAKEHKNIELETKDSFRVLTEYIQIILSRGYWEVSNNEIIEFNIDGKIIEYDADDYVWRIEGEKGTFYRKPIVSATRTTTITDRYYLSEPQEIHKLENLDKTWEIEGRRLDKELEKERGGK